MLWDNKYLLSKTATFGGICYIAINNQYNAHTHKANFKFESTVITQTIFIGNSKINIGK